MAQPDETSQDNAADGIYPVVARAGAYSWWLIGIGVVALAVLWLVARLWVLVLAAAVAAFLSRALDPPARYLRARGLPRALVAAGVLVGFILVLAGIVALLVPSDRKRVRRPRADDRGRDRRRRELAGRGQPLRRLSSGRPGLP